MTLVGSIIDANYVLAANPKLTTVSQFDLADAALQAQSLNQQTAQGIGNSYISESNNKLVTAVLIYNASGSALQFRSTDDSSGRIGKYPYDTTIQNGQWSVVLHVSASGAATGSIALLAYNIEDNNHTPVAIMGWNNPYSSENTSFGDCWNTGGFAAASWSQLFAELANGGTTGPGNATKNGYAVPYSIGQGATPIATLTVQTA